MDFKSKNIFPKRILMNFSTYLSAHQFYQKYIGVLEEILNKSNGGSTMVTKVRNEKKNPIETF